MFSAFRICSFCLCIAMTACSSPRVADTQADSPPTAESPGATSTNGSSGRKSTGSKSDAGKTKGSRDSEGSNETVPGSETVAGEPVSPSRSSTLRDPMSDVEASDDDTPAYADVARAAVTKQGKDAVITTTVFGTLPATLRNGEVLTLDTAIRRDGQDLSIYADGDEDGWTAYVSDRGNARELRGFSLQGDTAVFRFPWSLLGSKSRFRWEARTAWTLSSLTNTRYAFDTAPNGGTARYPGR